MSESEDDSSKTEEPSQKKLDEARKKGQIPATRELNHFAILFAFIFFMATIGPKVGRDTLDLLGPYITQPDRFEMDAAGVIQIFHSIVIGTLMLLLLPFLITVVASIAPAVLQRKIVFTGEQMKPKLSKISPLAGFKRLFGMKAIIEFTKNFLKIVAVGVISVMVVMPYRNELPLIMRATDNISMLEYSQSISIKILIGVSIFLFLLSIIDYLYQRFTIMKSLRMSRHEMKEEYKQQEGDPHVRQKLKQIRRERARTRMMANVPKADVIITNPTHFAVALKYDAMTMQAPVMLAKGADEVAARIRQKATDHKIPIIRNPPLARILYDTTDIDDEIPIEHYQAVAKIIGYVYRLKGKGPKEPPASGRPGKMQLPIMRPKK